MRKRQLLPKITKIVKDKDGKANEAIVSLTPSDVQLINEGKYIKLINNNYSTLLQYFKTRY